MRIGILGGTFDPPHTAHMALAKAAIEQLELDEVIFMPAYKNPNKGRGDVTPAKMRLDMVKMLVGDTDKIAISDLEITRKGPSYAVDTLTELSAAQPADYWFLLGADAFKGLPAWKQPLRLIRLCRLGVVLRPPQTELDVMRGIPDDIKACADLIKMPLQDISSTELRQRVVKNQPLVPWVPSNVINYIKEHKLYKI